jgi:predicted ATP-grasp superfamily ATP-dependent carboligase
VLLPCDDDGLELIARNRTELSDHGYLPIEADDDVVLAMLDKDRTYELAREIGIDVPLTVRVGTESDLNEAVDDLSYPCALKPVHAHVFARRFGYTTKAFTVHDRAALERCFAELLPLGIPMLVTEIVPGDEDQFYGYYSYLDAGGEPLFHLTKRKLRQQPPVFGVGCYHVTCEEPSVAEAGLRFMQGVGVRGLANVEWKRDARDGRLKLIECNHRFTAINELLRAAGLDLALLAYNRVTGRPDPALDHYRTGMRLWLPGQDFRAFLDLRSRGRLSLGQWLRSIAHRQHLPIFDWRDPRPTIGYNLGRVDRSVRRAAARGSARRQAQPARGY